MTGPFAVSTVTGNGVSPLAAVLAGVSLVVLAAWVVATAAVVAAGASAVADEDPQAATTSAATAVRVKCLLDRRMLLSLEEPL